LIERLPVPLEHIRIAYRLATPGAPRTSPSRRRAAGDRPLKPTTQQTPRAGPRGPRTRFRQPAAANGTRRKCRTSCDGLSPMPRDGALTLLLVPAPNVSNGRTAGLQGSPREGPECGR
jgi:hypothetical protein